MQTTGVLLLAIGDELYQKLAVVLAASIKKNAPDVPICLITDTRLSEETFSTEQVDLFSCIKFTGVWSGVESAVMAFKTTLPTYSPYDNTLYLDVDSILTPTHNILNLFEQLKDIEFAPYNSGIFNPKAKQQAYPLWGDYEALIEAYGLNKDAQIPQTNTSFIWFKKTEKVKEIFELANEILLDGKEFDTWRGAKPDELCFNIALCKLGYQLHQHPYEPVYLYFKNPQRSKEYIIENFPFFSIIGKEIKDQRIITIYNDFMMYYFRYHGFKNFFYYEDKVCDTTKRKIYGFWHICLINNWFEIVAEQLKMVVHTQLYESCENIFIGVVGSKRGHEEQLSAFQKMIGNSKIKISVHKNKIEEFEFPTLKLMQEHCKYADKTHVFYIHTKGVFDQRGDYWRDFLNNFNINKWRECQKALRKYEIVGVKWMEENASHPRHFSGNFFHARSEYISRLPDIDSLDKTNRFNAEFWHGMGNPKYLSLSQLMIDHTNHL